MAHFENPTLKSSRFLCKHGNSRRHRNQRQLESKRSRGSMVWFCTEMVCGRNCQVIIQCIRWVPQYGKYVALLHALPIEKRIFSDEEGEWIEVQYQTVCLYLQIYIVPSQCTKYTKLSTTVSLWSGTGWRFTFETSIAIQPRWYPPDCNQSNHQWCLSNL